MINLSAAGVKDPAILAFAREVEQRLKVLEGKNSTTTAFGASSVDYETLTVGTLVLTKMMTSPEFLSGLGGSGMRLEEVDGKWRFTMDETWVRDVVHLYEILIQQVKAQGGSVIISPAAGSGKIAQITRQVAGLEI